MGYVGLPLILELAKSGFKVAGIDIDEDKVRRLKTGLSHVDDISNEDISLILDNNCNFFSVENLSINTKIWVICVPTPLKKNGAPELEMVIDAANLITKNFTKGSLIILESTTYPGTTDTILNDIFQNKIGRLDSDYFLAFAPERIDPGRKDLKYCDIPRVVGGVTQLSTQKAFNFYDRFVGEVVLATSSREAEMSKLLENTFRHINIALINELSQFCSLLDIDIWNVIDCAATKPYGFMRFNPGPGVGGHCIPIDPSYLDFAIKQISGKSSKFIELANSINDNMPDVVVARVENLIGIDTVKENIVITLFGMTYKRNISDTRESPGLRIYKLLADKGYSVNFYDPFISHTKSELLGLAKVDNWSMTLKSDLIILLQFHDAFSQLNFEVFSGFILDMTGELIGKNVFHI